MKPKKDTQPMEEAYKQLDGKPAIDAVSQAAMGKQPLTDEESRVEDFNRQYKDNGICADDIEEAYAKIFEGLAMVARHGHESSEPVKEPDSQEDE